MKKISKKLFSLMLAVVMAIPTMLVLPSASSAAVSGRISTSYLTDEASYNSLISAGGIGTKTGTVTWDSTENAAYFNGGYITIAENPFSGVDNSTGFTISFDFKRLGTNENNSRMIDINDGTDNNTFAINAGSDSDTPYRRLLTLAKVNGTEAGYYASDTDDATYCPTYRTTKITNDTDLTNVWHNLTVIMDAAGYYSYYLDGVLRGTFTNNYGSTGNGHGLSPTSMKNQMASMTQVWLGKSIYTPPYSVYDDPTFKGYIKNVHLVAQDVNDTISSNTSIEDAISIAEAKLFGYAYTNATAAYKAYYNACEAVDAAEYGNDTSTLSSARTALINALNNLGTTGVYHSTPDYNPSSAFNGDYNTGHNASLIDPHYVSLYYATPSASTNTDGSANDNLYTRLVIPANVIAFWDGTTIPKFGAMPGYKGARNKPRALSAFYPTNASEITPDSPWKYRNTTGTYDFTWALDGASNTTVSNVATSTNNTDISTSTGNWYHLVGDLSIHPTFTSTQGYKTYGNIQFTGRNYNSELYATVNPSFSGVYVINYKGYKDAVDEAATIASKGVSDYKEGGLQRAYTIMGNAQNVSGFDADFTSSPTTKATTLGNNIGTFLTDYVNNGTTTTADTRAAVYQELRDTMKSERTIGDDTYTVAQAYENWEDFTDATAFKAAYEDVVAMFEDLNDDDNASGYAATSLQDLTDLSDALSDTFSALTISTLAVPTVEGSKYLGPNDTVTVTNNEGSGTMSFVVTYNDNTTYSGSVADGGTIKVFNEATDKSSARLVVTLTSGEDTVDSIVYRYTYVAAPVFTSDSAGNTVVTQGVYSVNSGGVVYAKSNNSFADATSALQYSYDGTSWNNYSTSINVFPNTTCPAVTHIYLKETVTKDGVASYSAVSTFNVIKENTFTIFTDNTNGTKYYSADSKISIEDTTHYTDEIIFYIQKADDSFIMDGAAPKKYTYSKGNGFVVSEFEDAETILGEEFITIYAYSRAADEAGYTSRVSQKLYSLDGYDELIYHESFNGSVSGSTYTSNDARGLNITAGSAGNANTSISVVEKAGDRNGFSGKNESGTSSDIRKNALKISGTNKQSSGSETFAQLASNPFATNSLAKQLAKENGVTISFWRALESAGTTTKTNVPTGTLKRNAIAFRKSSSGSVYDSIYGYWMIEETGNMSFTKTSSDYFDIEPSEYDQTQYTASKYSGYWQHVAVTVNPNAATVGEAVTIYLNGVPHNLPSNLAGNGGSYSISDLLDMITDEGTYICLAHDNKWQDHTDDIYLDDIRFYSRALTQKEIWDGYYDENADKPLTEGHKVSVTHDPTTITAYKLKTASHGVAAGSLVGQEFVDYYNEPSSNYSVEYYSYGTGLQTYHSADGIDWEIVGDSEGRVAYQNRDMFVKDNGNGSFTPMYYRNALDEVCTSIYNTASSSQKAYAGNLIWAPHVSYNLETNKWMMYVSISFWGDAKSAIIALQSVDGTPLHFKARDTSNNQAYSVINKSNGRPNSIDPCSYYKHNADGSIDKDTLYMAYGAWSQGESKSEDLCTIQLNKNGMAPYNVNNTAITYSNAKSAEDGTRICASQPSEPDGQTGEGAFITYNNGYYYLYVAYGVNDYNYVTRVFRSENPDGPFVDYNNNSATNYNVVHGTQIMAPHYAKGDDYIYMSTGHDSIYKAVNNNGETINIHSAHARPVSNNANGYREISDYALATRQKDLAGNITITHPMFYTQSGWAISMPEQYNGTDTSTAIKASEIDGKYSASTLHDIIDEGLTYSSKAKPSSFSTNWDFSEYIYFSHENETSGIIYGDGQNGFMNLDFTYELSYDDPVAKTTTYITIRSGNDIVAEGVVAKHDGVPELSYFNITERDITGVPTRAGSTIWALKQDDLPAHADFKELDKAYNEGDAILVSLDGKTAQYSAASVQDLITALGYGKTDSTKSAAKKRLVPSSYQSTINSEATAIENAINGLTVVASDVPTADLDAYEAAVTTLNKLDPDAYEDVYDEETHGYILESAARVANEKVKDATTKDYDSRSTIYVVDSSVSQQDVNDATSRIVTALSTCTKKYDISADSGVVDITANDGSYEDGKATYGTRMTFTAADDDTAFYLEVESNKVHKSRAFYGYGKRLSVKTIGELTVTTERRGTNEKRVKIIRNYDNSDNERPPVQFVDFVAEGEYTLPAAPAIAYYDFDGYYIGETKLGATTNITDDTVIVAKYIYDSSADCAINATAKTGGEGVNRTVAYNTKLELKGGDNAYGWVEEVSEGVYKPFYVGADMTLYAMESLTLIAKTEEEFDAYNFSLPNIHLRKDGVITNGTKTTFNAQIVADDMGAVKEYGVLIAAPSSNGGYTPITPSEAQVITENSGQQEGYAVLRAKSTKLVGANQFAISVNNLPDGYVYRGFLVYDDGKSLQTVYTDLVTPTE